MTDNLPQKADASKLVEKWASGFARLLPSHLREDSGSQWIASVKAVLATRPEIRQAAENDPNAFVAALIQAANKGLVPGSKEFHLVPFAPRQGQPRIIQGIEGYQGIIERIYRAGAVSTVIVETVKRNDKFSYSPGRDARPTHEVDWFGDRGELIGAYAYAVMLDGATSKVVIVGPDEIARAKAKSASASSKYSPWNTDPDAMWMKTSARRLENWVPTSSEYRRQKLRDAQAVIAEQDRSLDLSDGLELPDHLLEAAAAGEDADEDIDPVTGEVIGDIVDAEIVEDRGAGTGPGAADAGEGFAAPGPLEEVDAAGGPLLTSSAPPHARPDAGPGPVGVPQSAPQSDGGEGVAGTRPATPSTPPAPPQVTARQKQALRSECARLGIQSDVALKLTFFDLILRRPEGNNLAAVDELTKDDAEQVLVVLQQMATRADLEAWGAGQAALDD